MEDGTIIIIVNAVLAVLVMFGVWAKVSGKITAVKECIDVGHSATICLTDAMTALADGKLSDDELKKLKSNVAKFKQELAEARAALKK